MTLRFVSLSVLVSRKTGLVAFSYVSSAAHTWGSFLHCARVVFDYLPLKMLNGSFNVVIFASFSCSSLFGPHKKKEAKFRCTKSRVAQCATRVTVHPSTRNRRSYEDDDCGPFSVF